MRKPENRKAPTVSGWVIAAAAGLAAFGVLVFVGKFDLLPAAALAAVVAALVGLILGMQRGASGVDVPAQKAPARAEAAEATAPVQPVVEVASPAAPFVSAPVPEAKPKVAAKPKAAARPKAEGLQRLNAPRKGKADDLKEIEGIGPAMEKLINGMGFFHFDQIASWSDADVALVDAEMKGFKGRITRDKWVAQAKIIESEGLEAFRIRAKTNNY
ncbi:MAG: NADH:ubiquinone oxidoreductase [Rhodobacter sp.]|nr:NADH:ubiquinone oxidoreductase [Rhodobacter sp.]